jgi:hypothetical protein
MQVIGGIIRFIHNLLVIVYLELKFREPIWTVIERGEKTKE